MKKLGKISNKYEIDFFLFGVVSPEKEYKVSWHINQVMEISLEKMADGEITFNDGSCIKISNYLYEDDYLYINILRNKLVSSGSVSHNVLVPELKQFDYLIKVRDATEVLTKNEILEKLRSIPVMSYCTDINFEKLKKSRENLLFQTKSRVSTNEKLPKTQPEKVKYFSLT